MPHMNTKGEWYEDVETAVDAERERCAKIAEGQAEFISGATYERLCRDIAELIRNPNN